MELNLLDSKTVQILVRVKRVSSVKTTCENEYANIQIVAKLISGYTHHLFYCLWENEYANFLKYD